MLKYEIVKRSGEWKDGAKLPYSGCLHDENEEVIKVFDTEKEAWQNLPKPSARPFSSPKGTCWYIEEYLIHEQEYFFEDWAWFRDESEIGQNYDCILWEVVESENSYKIKKPDFYTVRSIKTGNIIGAFKNLGDARACVREYEKKNNVVGIYMICPEEMKKEVE